MSRKLSHTAFKTISEILLKEKQSIYVFQAFGIDHTFVPLRTLYEVCETRGIELELFIECLQSVDS